MKRRIVTAFLSGIGMLILIIDSKTALYGASEGLDLCLKVVIPSLLPFFVLSMMLTASISGCSGAFLRPLGRICGIPVGAEGLFAVGLLGGYPVGAQCITSAWQDGSLSANSARRMLGFCSNAGPAFLFGIVASKFSWWWIPWVLWGIHVVSAIFTGILLPKKEDGSVSIPEGTPLPMQTALKRSIRVMTMVCGWIVLFRVLITFLDRWFLWLLPNEASVAVMGVLELTNGCCQLEQIENTGLRFMAASGLLAFGGLCVTMQTVSVTGKLGLGTYFSGKLIQTVISLILSFGIQMLFPAEHRFTVNGSFTAALPVILAIFAILLRESKKRGSIPKEIGV